MIEATLRCVAEHGLAGTTVRKIADYANVTNGLIRFYFQSKDVILREAYRTFLERIFLSAYQKIETLDTSAKNRLRVFITANLSPPVVRSESVLLWANFIPLTYRDKEMAAIRADAYHKTTGQFEPLLEAAFAEDNRLVSQTECVRYAILINALIDGLWLEGSMSPTRFKDGELSEMGLRAVENLLQMEL